jgi:hypothetical protein
MCVLANQPGRDTKHVTPINMLSTSGGWTPRLVVVVGALLVQGRRCTGPCFSCRTAQQQDEFCDTSETAGIAVHVWPRQPRRQEPPKKKKIALLQIKARQASSESSVFSLRPAKVPEIGPIPPQPFVSGFVQQLLPVVLHTY